VDVVQTEVCEVGGEDDCNWTLGWKICLELVLEIRLYTRSEEEKEGLKLKVVS
jgi:hypothetical protein